MLIQSTPSRPNSQSTINKLLQKDLKQLIFSLDSNQLISLFKNLQIQIQTTSSKQFTKIGHKCSQCHTIFENFQSKGYGRDQHEALINSIKIIIESMISSSYRIQSIKKALKYCSKYKQPLINSTQGMNFQSSTKKSQRKVQGVQNVKMTKKHLEYGNSHQSSNKQNISKRINQTLDLSAGQYDDKVLIDSKQIRLGQKIQKNHEARPSSPVLQVELQQQNNVSDKKCSQIYKGKQCIYMQMHKHSQRQVKSLNARIQLLQEQNSMLKQLLLKDFNKQFFSKNKVQESIKQSIRP